MNRSKPWYQAFTSIYGFYQSGSAGLGGWTHGADQVQFVPFTGLGAGTYRIKHWLRWDQLDGTYYVNGQARCRYY